MAGERMGNNMQVSEPSAKYMVKASEYKLTEAGLIPNDWVASTIGKEFHIELGKMLDSEKNTGIPKPFLGNRSVQWGKIDTSSLGEIRLTPQDIQKYRLQKGDLLACEGGEIGRSAIWEAQLDECYYQKALHRLRPKNGLSTQLLLNILRRSSFLGDLNNFVTQTSIAHLPKEKFQTVPIAFPSSPAEQQAIATALSDTDALIDALEQLLVKKRQVKQGVAEKLLTRRERLKEFQNTWSNVRFGDAAKPRRDRIDPRTHQIQKFCIELENIGAGTGTLLGYSNFGRNSSIKTPFHNGDVLFGKLRAYLRKYWRASGDGLCSTEIWALAPQNNTISSEYLSQIVRLDSFIDITSQAYGTHMPRSDWKIVSQFELQLPPLDEQTAIAAILSDMDTDITELETRLGKVRQVKQGMMRELLTGRTRLV